MDWGVERFVSPSKFLPVFEVPADVNSPLVGLIHEVLPCDYYLLNLLP